MAAQGQHDPIKALRDAQATGEMWRLKTGELYKVNDELRGVLRLMLTEALGNTQDEYAFVPVSSMREAARLCGLPFPLSDVNKLTMARVSRDAWKAHHDTFHPTCRVDGPVPLPPRSAAHRGSHA